MFQDKMLTPGIPERVYALCKLVERAPALEKDLRDQMEPKYLPGNEKTSYFNEYRKAAEELGLIAVSDGYISIVSENRRAIASMENLRAHVNWHITGFKLGQFYKLTQAVFARDTACLRYKNLEEMIKDASQWANIEVTSDNIRAWRFWAEFMGLGYLSVQGGKIQFLPNAGIFLWDIIRQTKMKRGVSYTSGEWVEQVLPHIDLIQPSIETRMFTFGVSCGLRMLHDQGFIKIDTIMDQKNNWRLYTMNNAKIKGEITHITVLKG